MSCAPEEAAALPAQEPVYRLTEGLPAEVADAKAIHAALEKVPAIARMAGPGVPAGASGWTQLRRGAESRAHAARAKTISRPTAPARQRLAYDELLANQLALALIRAQLRVPKGRAIKGDGHLKAKVLTALPFALTETQKSALAEIEADMASPTRMLRLLQGDVGAGKTIVAMLALLDAVEAGTQGALMAPTELAGRASILRRSSRWHAPPACAWPCSPAANAGAPREEILAALARGEIDILVGTHALFSEDVAFRDLGLAVVDEQHRFGVHQRMKLQGKGEKPVDVLVMTATPIPRTLALTAYGDMEVSRITGRPPGRKPSTRACCPADRLDEVIEHLQGAIAKGARAYWVCPLVEESEKVDLAAVEERAAMLKRTCSARKSISCMAA